MRKYSDVKMDHKYGSVRTSKTRTIILCTTHKMSRKKIYKILGQYGAAMDGTWWYWVSTIWYCLELSGTESVEGGTGWYLVVLDHYNLVLLGIKWYWVDMGLLCLYILKKVEIWSDVTIAGRTLEDTSEQGKIELLSQLTMDG